MTNTVLSVSFRYSWAGRLDISAPMKVSSASDLRHKVKDFLKWADSRDPLRRDTRTRTENSVTISVERIVEASPLGVACFQPLSYRSHGNTTLYVYGARTGMSHTEILSRYFAYLERTENIPEADKHVLASEIEASAMESNLFPAKDLFYRTDVYNFDGKKHDAVVVPWEDVESYLGHPHEGTPGDDVALIAGILAGGGPSWVATAEGTTDEEGWVLLRG